MRKVVFSYILLAVFGTIPLIAQTATPEPTVPQEIVVQNVVGRVEREIADGRTEAVKRGMRLTPATVIITGVNSTLVIRVDDRVYTIRALQKDTIANLISALTANRGGVRIRGTADTSDVNTDSGPNRTNISTASTRAEDAADDEVEWVEE